MTPPETDQYEEHRRKMAARQRRISEQGRDVSPLPEIIDMERRKRTEYDLKAFYNEYFEDDFSLPFSDDHERLINQIQDIVLNGGQKAIGAPRGTGKTTMCQRAAIWACLHGHHQFPVLIGPDAGHAKTMLAQIKTDLETNDKLYMDFPEAVHPIRSLEGISNRCKSQLYEGERTHIVWRADKIVFPTVRPQEERWEREEYAELLDDGWSPSAGTVLHVAGITGRIAGMKHHTARGEAIRPDMLIIDDPQTTGSARSPKKCRTRKKVLSRVLKMGGPDKTVSVVMPCTVIEPGDVADEYLDRERHPDWRGERMKALYEWPDNWGMWEEYEEKREACLRNDEPITPATEFYRENREKMDKGAEVAWPERYRPDEGEISGLQYLVNEYFDDPDGFYSELQNQPQSQDRADAELPDADEVMQQINNRKRARVPEGCNAVTAYVDVHKRLLFWMLCAWRENYTGYVVDYGTYPEQNRRRFDLYHADRTIRRVHQGMSTRGAIWSALDACSSRLLDDPWVREDGAYMQVDRMLVDQGWKTDLVHDWVKECSYSQVMPARGSGIKANQKPISEYKRSQGDKIGFHWWIPSVRKKRVLRHVEIDTNFWKTFVLEALGSGSGEAGGISLFGDNPRSHRLLAEHLTSEYRVPTKGRGRWVDEWQDPPKGEDNHWLDCLVGCAAAASMEGVTRVGAEPVKAGKKKEDKVRLSDVYARKHG